MLTRGLSAVFEPRRLVLVGASDQPGKTGELFWRNLMSFPGEVVPVTESAATVGGVKAYASVADVPGDVDLAVVVVPAGAAPEVIRAAAAKGVRAAVVISGGFAEVGEDGARLQDELLAAGRSAGMRIIGPNCFGVQNCGLSLNASMAVDTPQGAGGISLVTQSGAYGMAVQALGIDERMRFAKVCATGNKADVGDAELLAYLGDDPDSRTLCFFVESLPDGRAFVEAAARVSARKPVIVAKTGRSAAGARAAASHTAAMASHERVWRAALEQAGVILARSGLEMMDAARALDSQPAPRGRRVAVITNSGGTGVELVDLLADEGLDVPALSAGLQDVLRPLLPAFASTVNPVDITPVWGRFGELYPMLVDRLARSGEVDAVVPVLLQRAAADERVVLGVRDAVLALRADGIDVPVYVCWVAPRAAHAHSVALQDAGIPCFEWPERTARAVGHAARFGSMQAAFRVPPPRVARPPGLPELPEGWLDAEAARRLLAAAGIATTPSRVGASADEAVAAAEAVGYPVVAKVLHPSVVHKSDVGGVRPGLQGPEHVREAATALLELVPGASVLIQAQASGVEVIVGGIRDPQFGPAVLVGLGGVFAEVIDDVVVGLAPLSRLDARDLLVSLRGHAVLVGARGTEPVDLDALADAVSALGDLLAGVPEIAELELNPVLVTATGCLAVDWRIRVENSALRGQPGVAESAPPGRRIERH